MFRPLVLALLFASFAGGLAQPNMPSVDGYWRYTVPNGGTNYFLLNNPAKPSPEPNSSGKMR